MTFERPIANLRIFQLDYRQTGRMIIMNHLVVFDFDGTLANSLPMFLDSAVEYSTTNDLPKPCLETLTYGYGHPDEHDFGWKVCKDTQREHLYNIYRMMDTIDPATELHKVPPLFDGVFETLHKLEELGHELAIVTAKPFAPLKVIIEHHDIHARFKSIRSYDDFEKRGERQKPHPDQLLSVMNEMDYSPDQTIMVGDTTMDIKMGKSAGTTAVGVTWGNHEENHLLDAGADVVLTDHFSDLLEVVKNHRLESQKSA